MNMFNFKKEFVKKIKKTRAGFTLVELIVVVAIVSIMAVTVIAVLNPFSQFQKANDARRKDDLSQIQKALEIYYQDNGAYPCSSIDSYRIISGPRAASCGAGGMAFDGSTTWNSPEGTAYMKVLPADPNSLRIYRYYSPDGQTYYLYASLERGSKDPQVCFPSGAKCTHAPAADCGSGICNYGISSPNTAP